MTLTLFSDACRPGVTLKVWLGVISEATNAGLWDFAVWDDPESQFGTGVVPVDISEWVRSLSSVRALQPDQDVWNAGKLEIVLDNRDGRFSPDNVEAGAPYAVPGLSGLRPGCSVSVTMTYGGVEYSVFAGYITDWEESWNLHGTKYNACNAIDPESLDRLGDAVMTVSAVDVWGVLAKQKRRPALSSPVGAGDKLNDRIGRILAVAEYSGPLVLSQGNVTFIATTLDGEIVSEINKTVESEGGVCYVDDDGTIVVRGRYDALTDPRSSNVTIAFGDKAGETLWSNLMVAPVSDRRIVNHAVYARSGGADQEVYDRSSVALYGICDDGSQPSDLLCEYDSQVLGLAQWAVVVGSKPEARIQSIEMKPRCDLATIAPLVLGAKIRDLVSVRVRPPSGQHHYLIRECFLSGIEHSIRDNDWTVTFSTSTATQIRKFGTSRWDSGTWGGSPIDSTAAIWFI